ncbi:hydrogenase maturation nickel metallochaperone HypA [Candidatus Nitrotoga sp. M5]|uniref:hydrogenase maturation nickel metallochaperone HypA n=1 Tax=Candidatus Nitrotoga sp. M5 TaxID=2890409 RepID=UPI001EF6D796|nr:hydrogenase maturation nickel metallochaperone HypA [Candidatus Nitrotoga sp. M5]CAH1387524.1 Hydrogenase maturation factor HypA [Candidatus Nitrotoga sp. M5]
MHEMSLAESVLQIIEDTARKQGYTRVKTVWLEIGQLACVEQASLRFCFDLVVRDSIAHEACLEITEIAGQGRCAQCSAEMPIAALYEACPKCGSYEVQVTGGDEMRVKELEVE